MFMLRLQFLVLYKLKIGKIMRKNIPLLYWMITILFLGGCGPQISDSATTLPTSRTVVTEKDAWIAPDEPDTPYPDEIIFNPEHATQGSFSTTGWSPFDTPQSRALLEFDLGSLPKSVQTAYLWIYIQQVQPNKAHTAERSVILERNTASWEETDVTWNTKPASVETDLSIPYNEIIENDWLIFEITDLYHDWKNGTYPNYGVQLRIDDETFTNTGITARSSDYPESEYHPRIVIVE